MRLVRSALVAIAIVVLSVPLLDGRLALAMSSVPAETRHAINQGVGLCEWLFGFRVSTYLSGAVLIIAGVVARAWKRVTVAQTLFFIGLVHLTARFLTGIMKTPFSRLRPFEALVNGNWHDTWFAAVGNSFPSGHAVHFWGLFFPLVILFPRF